MKVARDRSPTCATDNVVVVCATVTHVCTRERNAATVHRSSAGRREPPACLRATAARAAPRPPRPRHAPPAPAPAARTRHAEPLTPHATRHTPHAARPLLAPHASHCHCRAPIAPAAGSRTARISMCSLSGDVSGLCGEGEGHAPRRGGLVLRAASRISLAGFLRAPRSLPSAERVGPRRPSRSPAEPRRINNASHESLTIL